MKAWIARGKQLYELHFSFPTKNAKGTCWISPGMVYACPPPIKEAFPLKPMEVVEIELTATPAGEAKRGE